VSQLQIAWLYKRSLGILYFSDARRRFRAASGRAAERRHHRLASFLGYQRNASAQGVVTEVLVRGPARAPVRPLFSQSPYFPYRRWSAEAGFPAQALGRSFSACRPWSYLGAALTPLSSLADATWNGQSACCGRPPSAGSHRALGLVRSHTPGDHLRCLSRNSPNRRPPCSHAPAAIAVVLPRISLHSCCDARTARYLLLAIASCHITRSMCVDGVFLYLVQDRKFALLKLAGSQRRRPLPPLLGAGVGGMLTGSFAGVSGERWALGAATAAMPAAAFVVARVNASKPYLAVVALATCFGCVELTEGAFLGRRDDRRPRRHYGGCGFRNTGGNLGGIQHTHRRLFSGQHLWSSRFLIGSGSPSSARWLVGAATSQRRSKCKRREKETARGGDVGRVERKGEEMGLKGEGKAK